MFAQLASGGRAWWETGGGWGGHVGQGWDVIHMEWCQTERQGDEEEDVRVTFFFNLYLNLHLLH